MSLETRKLLSTVSETDFGWVGLARSELGLKYTTLPKNTREACLAEIGKEVGETVSDDSAFGDLPDRLRRYFRGEAVSFPDQLDFSGKPPFRRAVWLETRAILQSKRTSASSATTRISPRRQLRLTPLIIFSSHQKRATAITMLRRW